MLRERVVAHLNLGVRSLDVVGLKRRASHDAGVGDDPQTPDVNFVRVPCVDVI